MSDTKLLQIRDREVKGQWFGAAFTAGLVAIVIGIATVLAYAFR